MKPFIEPLGSDGDMEARLNCDGTNLWFEVRKAGTDNWEKIARRVNREWVSVKKGAKVTMRNQSVLLPKYDAEINPDRDAPMKPKDEPFNTLGRLLAKGHTMPSILASLADIAGMVAQDDQTDQRHRTEAERLRNALKREAERCQRFQDGKPSPEDLSGQN